MDVEGNRSAGSTSEPTLVMEDVSFSYANGREGAGVRRVDLQAASGEVVLLCGPSGCGKTTLTRLANGLAPTTTRAAWKDECAWAGWTRPTHRCTTRHAS